jgi:hypothetical protein
MRSGIRWSDHRDAPLRRRVREEYYAAAEANRNAMARGYGYRDFEKTFWGPWRRY